MYEEHGVQRTGKRNNGPKTLFALKNRKIGPLGTDLPMGSLIYVVLVHVLSQLLSESIMRLVIGA